MNQKKTVKECLENRVKFHCTRHELVVLSATKKLAVYTKWRQIGQALQITCWNNTNPPCSMEIEGKATSEPNEVILGTSI